MNSCGICAVLKTFDPNINDALISKFISNKYQLKVLKLTANEKMGAVAEELDSGIVSITGSKNAVDATVICEKLYNIKSTVNLVKVISMVIGIIISVIFAVFGLSLINSLFVVVYQLLWILPAFVLGKFIYKVL